MQSCDSAQPRATRNGSATYAHSPYLYRTNTDELPVSPRSESGGRPVSLSASSFCSPTPLNMSVITPDAYPAPVAGIPPMDLARSQSSHPCSPLSKSVGGGVPERSQPIQVGSAPNVHARYRRGLHSPVTAGGAGNDSGSRGAFPSSPPASLPPRSPFFLWDDSASAFVGAGSAPTRTQNNPYRIQPSKVGVVSTPPYSPNVSGVYRGNGGGSGVPSPNPYYGMQGAPLLSSSPPHRASPPVQGSSTLSQGSSPQKIDHNHNSGNGATTSYAPTGFSMPPTMSLMTSGSNGSYGESPNFRSGARAASYADTRSAYATSPLAGSATNGGRPSFGSSLHNHDSLTPTPQLNGDGCAFTDAGSHARGALPSVVPSRQLPSSPPPQSASLQAAHFPIDMSNGTYPASFPFGNAGRRGLIGVVPSAEGHPSGKQEPADMTAKLSPPAADDATLSSSVSSNSTNSIREDLPLCPNDDACTLINDRKHQKKYAHTCRLFPCYHGHIRRHAKMFRHAPGQSSLPEGMSANAKMTSDALASVNFSTISPDAPNAYRIYVSHGDQSYEIFGDWATVKVHTFKRYLHQVYHIAPCAQVLSLATTGQVLDDDISAVKAYGIDKDAVIQLRSNIDDVTEPGRLRISLDDL